MRERVKEEVASKHTFNIQDVGKLFYDALDSMRVYGWKSKVDQTEIRLRKRMCLHYKKITINLDDDSELVH